VRLESDETEGAMPLCQNCGSRVNEDARFCPACGAAASTVDQVTYPGSATQPRREGASLGPHVVNLLACLMLVIGPFLPWATAGIFSASGMQKTNNEAIVIMLLGLVGIAVSLVSLLSRRNRFAWVLLVVGAVCLVFSVYYYFALRDQLADVDSEYLSASLGAGIYVCMIASVVALVVALAVGLRRKTRVA
jgi:uncharacterized membrane protein YjfL (UPF0719 family)